MDSQNFAYIDNAPEFQSSLGMGSDVGGSLIETLNAGLDLKFASRQSFRESEPSFDKQIKDIRNVLHANLHGGSWDREEQRTGEFKEHETKIQEALATFRSLIETYHTLNEKVGRLEKSLKASAETTKTSLKTIHAFSTFLNSLDTPQEPFPHAPEPEPEPEPEGSEEPDKEDDIRLRESREIVEIQRKIVKVAESIEARDQTKALKDAYLKEVSITKLYLHTFFKEINGVNIGNTCSLCLQRPVTHYLNPCGHTGCSECLEAMRSTDYTKHCYLCRKQVNSYHPLYFC